MSIWFNANAQTMLNCCCCCFTFVSMQKWHRSDIHLFPCRVRTGPLSNNQWMGSTLYDGEIARNQMPVNQLSFSWNQKSAAGISQTRHPQSFHHRWNQNKNDFEYFHGTLFDGQRHRRWQKCIQNGVDQSGKVYPASAYQLLYLHRW